MKKNLRNTCKIISLILAFVFFLTGCGGVNDSLGSGDEFEFLNVHSTDTVYKVYVVGNVSKFLAMLYNGDMTLDDLNKKLPTDPQINVSDSDWEETPCYGHKYIIKCQKGGDYTRVIGTCYIDNSLPGVMEYIEDSRLVFDNSVVIEEVYVMMSEAFDTKEYIYYVTNVGDFIFIKHTEDHETVYSLVPAEDFCKHCAQVYETFDDSDTIGGYDFIGTFKNMESYRHTEPYKPE